MQAKYLPSCCRGRAIGEGEDQVVDSVRPLKDEVAQFEKVLLERALTSCGWNRSEAARRLKISYPTMLQKIKRYGLRIPN